MSQPGSLSAQQIRSSFLNGMAYISAFLGAMSLLAVLAFHFPEYLTTPRLREIYSENQVRTLLYSAMILATLLSVIALLFSQKRPLALLGLCCLALAILAGGSEVPLDATIAQPRYYMSLDWVLLDLVLIATLFINLELFFRLKEQQVILRRGWRVDLAHYIANHLFSGLVVVLLFIPAEALEQHFSMASVQTYVSALPLVVQVLLIMFLTDLAQYWVHRAFHQVPLLWRFHKIHHSVEKMDWLAGSRLHLVDVLISRSLSLIPMVVLGFSNQAINLYLPLLALQAVFIHCNLKFEFASLQKIIATPKFHHWHHTSDPDCTDKNFSVTFPVFDVLFNTFYSPRSKWPENYGLTGEFIEERYLSHCLSPFRPAQERSE
jgi:sterol desaturase/sphingolipid hydroxylase (fatty acid hydroxylase superfamily)